MHKQVVFPHFLGESEIAVVVIIPSLKEELRNLFERFHSGEEVDYWFSWDLVVTDTAEYLVVLELNWDQGEELIVAFSQEMWEFILLMAQKENLVIMADWNAMEEGTPVVFNEEGEYKPYAILIRDIHLGLEKLYNHVKELASFNQDVEELVKLQLILEGTQFSSITYH